MAAGSSYYSSMSLLCFIVFLTICCFANCSASSSIPSSDSNSNGSFVVVGQREFDYFKLALQWPPTYCRRTKHCCSSNACCRGANAPSGFTIHGLWPEYNDGTWPVCCTHAAFDEKEVSTLFKALDTYWPSLSCGTISNCFGKKGSFWAHEWGKHGTCSAPVVHDEYNYFLTALNVFFKYNVTEVLNEAGYVPSNSEMYPVGGIIFAIQNAFHATPQLPCSNGALQELYLCFYKDFTPRDCVISPKDNSGSSCPKYISLPTYSSLELKDISNGVDLPRSSVEDM